MVVKICYLNLSQFLLQQRLVKDFVKILNQVNSEELPAGLKLPESYNHLVSEMKNNKHNAKEFALMVKGMVYACSLTLYLIF